MLARLGKMSLEIAIGVDRFIVTEVRLVQFTNASFPMLMFVQSLPKVTEVRLVQDTNAKSPMLVTPEGIEMEVRPEQP